MVVVPRSPTEGRGGSRPRVEHHGDNLSLSRQAVDTAARSFRPAPMTECCDSSAEVKMLRYIFSVLPLFVAMLLLLHWLSALPLVEEKAEEIRIARSEAPE